MVYEYRVKEKEDKIVAQRQETLTPHEFFLLQGKGMERPFTGKYWWVKDMGTYSCKVCTQKLFVTEHKFHPNNGYSNFWTHILDSVSYRKDSLENHKVNANNAYINKKFRDKLPERRAV